MRSTRASKLREQAAVPSPDSASSERALDASPRWPGKQATDSGRGRGATLRALLTQPVGVAGTSLILLLIVIAIFAPIIATHDPNAQALDDHLLGPNASHFFGTDEFGRDIYSRVVYGTRISLSASIGSVLMGAFAGVIGGLAGGYFGGWVDTLIGRVTDIVLAFPGLLLGIVVAAILGPGLFQVATAVAIINVPIFVRLARSSAVTEKSLDYIAATESMGASRWRIVLRHILPNVRGPIIVQLSLSIGEAVLLLAGLSFIGLGVQPPTSDWGVMLNESRPFLAQTPLAAVFPGLALAILILGCNFLADGLRNALDVERASR